MIRELLLGESIEGAHSVYTVSLFIEGDNSMLDEDKQKLKKLLEENYKKEYSH